MIEFDFSLPPGTDDKSRNLSADKLNVVKKSRFVLEKNLK